MFDIEKLANSILRTVGEPINRLAERVKAVEERKLPTEKEVVVAVMAGIDPVLAALGKQLEEMRNAFLVDVKAVRDAVAEMPEVPETHTIVLKVKDEMSPVLAELSESLKTLREQVAETLNSLESAPELPDIPKMIHEIVDMIPKPKDGEPGEPGKSVTVEDIAPVVQQLVDQAMSGLQEQVIKLIPPAKDGEPGRSVTVEDVTPLIQETVIKRIRDLEPFLKEQVERIEVTPGKDGVGLAGAVIDRNNHLVITLSDGTVCDLGPVVGKDADMKELARLVRQLIDDIPKPRDGFGFEDMSVEYDGRRSFTLKFVKGEAVKEFTFKTPAMIYQNVYQAGKMYEPGDVVTWAGAMWHCDKETDTKPGDENDNWTLAVKRGRNGKEVVSSGSKKPPTVKV